MEPRELLEKLGPGEKQILMALGDSGRAAPDDLVGRGVLEQLVQVMNAASWLRSKGLVKIREKLMRHYSLADPSWGERELPERQALRLLILEKEMDVVELQRKGRFEAGQMPIVLGWLKKKGWADIKQTRGTTVVTLTEGGRLAGDLPGADELLIRRLAEGELKEGEADPQILSLLKQRKEVIEERKRVERTIELTEAGRKLLDLGLRVTDQEAQVTPELLQTGAWRNKAFRRYDVNAFAPSSYAGKFHPLTWYLEKIRRIFLEMGFEEIEGNFVGPAFWAFDALFQPQDHPARDMLDTFYVESSKKYGLPGKGVLKRVAETHETGGTTGSTGWGYRWDPQEARRVIVRPHTTADTIRYLAEHPDPPRKAFIIGKNFRRDAPDATHLPEFHQIEGVVMEEGANLAMLIGTIREFYRKMGFDKVRFRPGYFPYTEPSMEPEAYIRGRWIELGGSGIFRPEVTAPFGITTPVLAWGLGLERLVMVLEGLSDIRTLVWNDLEWLKGSKVVW